MSARKADATQTNIKFTYGDETYEVLPTTEWTLDTVEAMEDGKIVAILKSILVGDGYARFAATKPRLGELTEFFEALQAELGIAGN